MTTKKIVKKNKETGRKLTQNKKREKPIGEVTHYFSDIKVAVIKLKMPLKIGTKIRIVGGEETDFNQEIKSMQIDHEPVKLAKKGKTIGMKVKEKVREGYKIYKI